MMEQPELNKRIGYKDGYKYQLAYTYQMYTDILPENNIFTEYIDLYKNGLLVIRRGYCWDGPSGPTIDTKNFMRGSLEHDAFYQLMRMERLPYSYRVKADKRLYNVCREDGMSYVRANCVYAGVRVGGRSSAKPTNRKKIITAP